MNPFDHASNFGDDPVLLTYKKKLLDTLHLFHIAQTGKSPLHTACCCLLIFIFSAVYPLPKSTTALGSAFFVQSIKFKGIKNISRKKLAETLAVRPINRWRFWKAPDSATMEDLEDDRLRIKQFYRDRGYFQTTAAFKIEELDKKRKSEEQGDMLPVKNIVFEVAEGPQTAVDSIRLIFDPPGTISDRPFIDQIPLKRGQALDSEKYRDSKKRIIKILGNRGYPFAKVGGHVTVDIQSNKADVAFDVTPGRKYKFGPLSVSKKGGSIEEKIVRRAIRFKQGDTYATSLIEESQRNLYNMDVFRVAVIKPGKPAPGADEIPMHLESKPKKRQRVKLGAGYGTEDGIRAKAAWTYRNLFGRAGNATVSAKRSEILENAQVEYAQPYIVDSKTHFRSKAGVERDFLESYQTRSIFSEMFMDRDIKKFWTVSIGYNLEINRVEDLDVTNAAAEDIGTEENYLISSVMGSSTYDSTNDTFNPSQGSGISLSYEQASTLLGSEIKFLSPAVEMKHFMPLPWSTILAGRFRVQTVLETENTQDLPIFKRLFLGGSHTVRGYGYQELPPLDADENPIGGLTSLNGNLEWRYPLYKKVSGVVFLDLGLLSSESFQLDFTDTRYSCGAGLRYNTIIGPIRFDLGYKLNPPTKGDLGFSTNKNKEIEAPWRIHFSIGHTF